RGEITESHRRPDGRAAAGVAPPHDRGGDVAGGVESGYGLAIAVEHLGVDADAQAAIGAYISGVYGQGIERCLCQWRQARIGLEFLVAENPLVEGLAAVKIRVSPLAGIG